MRNFLLSFLILSMIASTMVCVCGHEARAESPVAGHHHSHDHDHDGGPTFKHDCKTADMQFPQQVSISKPELKSGFDYDHSLIAVRTSFVLVAENHEIRGPPPDWPDTSYTQPSILLITQRLLI